MQGALLARRLARTSFLAVAAFVSATLVASDRFPERVPSHFDFAGKADAWMPAQQWIAWMLGAMGIVTLAFLALELLVAFVPKGWIHLPHRDLWLAPERERATRSILVAHLYAIGLGTLLLIHWAARLGENLGEGGASVIPRHDLMGALLPFVALCVLVTVRLHLRFRNPPADPPPFESRI